MEVKHIENVRITENEAKAKHDFWSNTCAKYEMYGWPISLSTTSATLMIV